MTVWPLWFDSLGAKSSSLLVETPDLRLLVDPGAAEMQPSFPLPPGERRRLRERALGVIREAARAADLVFISHYHYDHHTLPREAPELYGGKGLWIKDPNRFINRSQWRRARLFLQQLCELAGRPFEELLVPAAGPPDGPGEQPSRGADRRWLEGLRALWSRGPWVGEGRVGDVSVSFAEGRVLRVGSTRVRFVGPLFHGREYDRVGWVVALVVEHGGSKLLYSSDLQGPVVEDYARWIEREAPQLVVLDGPPTYLLGYMFGRRELERALANARRILERTPVQLILYDHHLPRDVRFRERTAELWALAERLGKRLLTAAQWMGRRPLVLGG